MAGDPGGAASSGLLARVAEHAGIALVVLDLVDGDSDADLVISWVNDAFVRTTRYPPQDVLGQSLRTFYQYRWHPIAFRKIARQVARGEVVELSLPFRDGYGADLWLRVSLRDLPGGDAPQWVCTATDVTEQVEKSDSQLASLEFERRTHADLSALSQVSDILGDADHPDVLTDVGLLLSRTLVRWAGFFLADDGLRLVSGINPEAAAGFDHDGARRRRCAGHDEVDALLSGRVDGPRSFPLDAEYPQGSTSARVQSELREHFATLIARAQEMGDPEPDLLNREIVLFPLPSSRDHLGLLAAMSRRDNGDGFDGRDLTMLEVVARRVGIAVENVRLYTREHRLAETLQLAMLPEQAAVEGLDVWTYYSPNSAHAQVGGDWYDILEISPDVAGFVIGDVVGHDVEAAAIMGQLRSIVRSYAYEVVDPGPVLDRVDQLLRGMRIPRAASLIYSTMRRSESGWVYDYSRAGHLPPLLMRDGTVTQLTDGAGALLGFGSRARTAGQVVVRPGDALVLYTDGLIERRDRTLRAGLESLVGVAASITAPDAAGIGEELLANLAEAPEDDVAVVVVRFPHLPDHEISAGTSPRTRRWTLPSEPESIGRARHAVVRTCQAWRLGNVENAELVVSELLANAVLHGWGHVTLRLFDTGEGLRIEVEDANPAPPVAVEGHVNGIGGYGIQIVSRLADWGWRPAAPGKIVWAKLRATREGASG